MCRASHGYTERQTADKLGMTPEDYNELETSAAAMTPAQAGKLAALFKIDAEYFLESSRQLELLLTRAYLLSHFQLENQRQEKLITQMLSNLESENARLKEIVEITKAQAHKTKVITEIVMNAYVTYDQTPH